MQHLEFEPSEALQNSIQCFWYDRREFGEVESSFEVVPDGYAEIIFHFGSGCSIAHNGNIEPLPSPFMIGLLNQPAHFYAKNSLEIIGIRCYPWSIFDLLELPSGKNGVQIFEHSIAQLQPILAQYIKDGKIEEAITHVQKEFLSIPQIFNDNTLSKAGNIMRETKGTMSVSQIATEAHSTVRTLERKFKQSSGHTVKDVSGLIRFEQVRNQLWLDPESNLAALAIELGYTDQAHLSREFKRYSGTTPAAFARKAKKGKQIISSDFITFKQKKN